MARCVLLACGVADDDTPSTTSHGSTVHHVRMRPRFRKLENHKGFPSGSVGSKLPLGVSERALRGSYALS